MSLHYDVFISYSSIDKARVMPWAEKLREGGLNPFVDSQCIVGGDDWQNKIVAAIDSAKLVFFIASRTSFNSDYTKKELAIAEKRKKTIVPIYIEAADAPGAFEFMLVLNQTITGYNRPADDIWSDILKALAREDLEWKPPVAPTPSPAPAPTPVVVVHPPVVAVHERRLVREPLDLGSDLPRIEGPDEPIKVATPTPRKVTRPLNERRATQPLAPATTSTEPSERAASPTPDLIAKETPTAITKAMDRAEKIAPAPSTPLGGDTAAPQKKKATQHHATLPARPKRKLVIALSTGAVSCAMILLSLPFFRSATTPASKLLPPPVAESLSAAAIRLTNEYYAAPKAGKNQTTLMDSELRPYFEHAKWERSKIVNELEEEAKRFPSREYLVQGKPVLVRGTDAGAEIDCQATVKFALSNEVVMHTGTLTGLVTVGKRDQKTYIIGIKEIGERKDAKITYLASGQQKRATALITSLMQLRNTKPSPDFGAFDKLLASNVSYQGAATKRSDVIKAMLNEIDAEPIRDYTFQQVPTVISKTPASKIMVEARLNYVHRRGADQAVPTNDIIDAVYEVSFSPGGTATISGLQETRQPSAETEIN